MKRFAAAILFCTGLYAEQPVTLLTGLGTWSHPIATRQPRAQKYFDQGLILWYGFNRYEALRSFRKAAELDPGAPMAYWGISLALGPYVNMDMDPDIHMKEACEALKTGLGINGISETDKAWLQAAQARCPDFSDAAKYVTAMRDLAARYPDDPDAQTLYAEALMLPVRWRWYGNDGKPAEGVPEAERILEAVMRREPYHPGANHLYIHVVESSPTPERAIPSAQRLMGIVPAAGHMVHMPGHIWLVLGDYDNAVAVNERAVAVDREYFAKTGVTASSYYPYYLHNLQFIVYSRAMQGRLADSRAVEAEFSDAVKPMAETMPDMADLFHITITMGQLRMRQWDDLLAAPRPKADNGMAMAFWRFSRAMALAGKGRSDEARQEQAAFERLQKTLDRSAPWGMNRTGSLMDLASTVLEARLETSPDAAASKWKRAVEIQDALVYDEPPEWYYPVRESLGAALLLSHDASGAEAVFREGLRRSPNNGRMLFGLHEALVQEGNGEAAAWVQKEFQAAWKGADVQLRIGDL